MERKTGKILDKKSCKNISLIKWENVDGDGKPFVSFSLMRTAKQRKPENSTEIVLKTFSLNCLTKGNLSDVKTAIDLMQHAEAGVEDLLESG